MNLQRLWSWLAGFLVLKLDGDSLEKFINIAASRGIMIWDIQRLKGQSMLVRVRLSALKPLRHIRRRSGVKFRVVEKKGLPFYFWQMKRRKALTLGAILFVATLYVLSSFVWFVDINGVQKVSRDRVLKALAEQGIRPGVWRYGLDLKGAEKYVAGQVPGVAWAGLEMQGTRITVKVVEKVLPPPRVSQQPADVVAKREGLISQVLVMVGEAVVKPGDMVKKGRILISGNVHTLEGPGGVDTIEAEEGLPMPVLPRQVSARGIVRARTWNQGYGEAQIVEQGYRPSGAKTTSIGIKWSKKEIIIKGPQQSPYPHVHRVSTRKNLTFWRNYRFPVEIVTTEFQEMRPYTLNRGVEGARTLARQQAIAQIIRVVGPQAHLLKEQVKETGDPGDNLIQMGITWETVEDIGQVQYWE